MNQKLQNKLFEKYPKLFKQKDYSIQQSGLFFGIQTGPGWYQLLDVLCDSIQSMIDNNRHNINHQLEFTQIKEKYGSLHAYYGWNPVEPDPEYGYMVKPELEKLFIENLEGRVSFAECMSHHICEECGMPGENKLINGWWSTRCNVCRDKNKIRYIWRRIKIEINSFIMKWNPYSRYNKLMRNNFEK